MDQETLILQKLEKIEKEVEEIREHMVDVDTLLTAEDRLLLGQSIQHEKEGKLVSLEDVEYARTKAR